MYPPPAPILSQLYPIHIPTCFFLKIHLNIILLSTSSSPKWSLSLRFPHQDPIHPLSSPPYPLHAPPISFCSILSPEKFWVRSADHSAPHFAVFSTPLLPRPFLGPNILLSALFSNILSLRSSPQYQRPSFTPIQNKRQNNSSVLLNL